MSERGFIIGQSLGLWYCERGLLGYGRCHALERSSWKRGWLEQGAPCLWTQAVTVGFVVASQVCGRGGHEPVGWGTKTLAPIKRIKSLPGRNKFMQGDTLLLNAYPFQPDSVELHVNLRHYRNFQMWDAYLLQLQSLCSLHARNVVKELHDGVLILCRTKRRKPFDLRWTCGAVVPFASALERGWEHAKNNTIFYCPICASCILRKSYELLTPD